MNKQIFMVSMASASETAMKLGITADNQIKTEEALVTAAKAIAEKEVADKKLPKKEIEKATKEAVDLAVKKAQKGAWGKDVAKQAKKIFIFANKSIRAFHESDDVEWKIVTYEDNLEVFKNMFGTIGTSADWKKNVVNLAEIVQEELDKHKPNKKISHDNGKFWKKNKNDIARFWGMAQCVESLKKIVS